MIELLLQADRLLTVDLVDAADAIYRKVADADPRNAIAVVGMARCALARGDDHEAYRLAARALAIDPQNDMARRMEARLDEVLRTRGEVPGQGDAASSAATPTAEAATGAGPVPVKHRWPATPTSVRQAAVAPSVDPVAPAAPSADAPAGAAAVAASVETGTPTSAVPSASPAPSTPSSGAAAGSSWAARIHHDEPPGPVRPPAPPSGSSVGSDGPAQPAAPDPSSATSGGSGTQVPSDVPAQPGAPDPPSGAQAPSGAPSSPSKRSLLDRLRGR